MAGVGRGSGQSSCGGVQSLPQQSRQGTHLKTNLHWKNETQQANPAARRGQTPLQAALLHGAAQGGEGDGDLGLSGHAGQTGWGRGKPALEVHGLSKGYRLD